MNKLARVDPNALARRIAQLRAPRVSAPAAAQRTAPRAVGYSGESSFDPTPVVAQARTAPVDLNAGWGGNNLSQQDLFTLTDQAAAKYDLPPEVMRAIALQESDGTQWDANGNPIRNDNGNGTTDWGVMQLNTEGWLGDELDVSRAQSDERYNVDMGAKELRVASDHWFNQKYGHPFTMDWYQGLPADQQKEARADLFRSYNGWLPDTSNAIPYENKIASGAIGQMPPAGSAPAALPPTPATMAAPSAQTPSSQAPGPFAIPNANLVRGSQGPEVEQLQNTLVSLGYMTQEEMDTGPGIFGPRTQAALGRFQQDHGIDYDGSAYGPQSRAALTQVQGQGQTAGSPASPALPDPATAARSSAPTLSAPVGGTGDITSAEQANAYFTTQWAGASPYNTQTGVDYGFSDCGPTSTLMIAASLGLTDAPNPATAEDQIDRVRDLALGYDSTESQGTNMTQMANAISAMGGTSQYLDMSLPQVDQALASGQRVLIAGNPWGAWGADMDANGQYLNHRNPGGHFVAILGKTPEGKYLVADPLSAVGVIEVTGDQIQAFWNEGAGNSGAMAVGR